MSEKYSKIVKEFTKDQSIDQRLETAKKIKEKRKVGRERGGRIEELEQKSQEQLVLVGELEKRLDEISSSLLRKISNYFELRKTRADMINGKKTYDELQEELNNLKYRKSEYSRLAPSDEYGDQNLLEEIPDEIQEARKILDDFYEEQEKKWSQSEYSKEDVEKYFSEEYLAALSVNEYALLMKRFSGKMVAHVTRQGIRDHTGMVYHIGGAGEYAAGFVKMVEDGRLRSPLGIKLIEKEKEKALVKYLCLDNINTKDEALEYLDVICGKKNIGGSGSYADKIAVHFATEEVADDLYGSERGNEIFIAYPSELIASQYFFSGQLISNSGGYWNDQWVWANEERGISLNSGLVFIPKEAQVDRKTGSRYEIDKDGKPVANEDYKKTIKNFVESPDFDNNVDQMLESLLRFNDASNQKKKELLEPLRVILETKFGITDFRLQNIFLDYGFMHSMKSVKKYRQEHGQEPTDIGIDLKIEDELKKVGIFYKEATDTISSEEFWENHFAKNPEKKPNKIIYYKGQDPTKALKHWRSGHNINVYKDVKGDNLGFAEREVSKSSDEANVGIDRFRSLAEKVIDDYYANKINEK